MKYIKLTYSELAFSIITFVGLLLAILGSVFLPNRFFNDVPAILQYVKPGLIGSYHFTSFFYNIATPLGKFPMMLLGFIQFLTIIILLIKIGIPKKFHKINLKNLIVYSSFFVLAIYLCMPTKEYINFIYMSIVVLIYNSTKLNYNIKKRISLFLIFLYGVFFRPYYLLIGVLIVFLYLFNKFRIKNKAFMSIIFSLIFVIIISVIHNFTKDQYLTIKTRHNANVVRVERDNVNTAIQAPIKVDSWYDETISILYGFFSVNVPFNGFKHIKSPHVIAFVIWEIFMFILLYHEYKKAMKNKEFKDNSLLFYFFFSFIIVQGIFEPDLGSAVRHKIGFFPVIYYLLYHRTLGQKSIN